MPTELRIVYDGAALAGRTSSMLCVQAQLPRSSATRRDAVLELVSTAGELELRVLAVVGAVYNAALRAELRTGAHSFVFVVDSQRERWEANEDTANTLARALVESGPRPVVLQLDKRDLPNALSVDRLARLDRWSGPVFESSARRGMGVWEPFEAAVLLAARSRGVEAEAKRLLDRRHTT